jgi:pimeloyl-ACP methyl ester carboxylesterase
MTGSTPEWVLLRGLTRERRHWGDFPERMETTIGAKVHCFDLPGNGQLNHLKSPDTVEAMADWCHEEIVRAGVRRPCAVLAMSLGAMVAVAWAGRHPEDIDRAVLINTSLRPFSAFYQRLQPRNYLRVLALLAMPASARRIEASIFRMTTCRASAAAIRQWVVWRTENPVSRRNALRQLRAAIAYRAPDKKPIAQLLLLASACDGLVAPACSKRLAAQWQVPLQLHPTAGHDLPLDDPDWVLRQTVGWLAKGS